MTENIFNEVRRLEAKLDLLNILAMKTLNHLLSALPLESMEVKQAADRFEERLKAGDPLAVKIAADHGLKFIGKEDTDHV